MIKKKINYMKTFYVVKLPCVELIITINQKICLLPIRVIITHETFDEILAKFYTNINYVKEKRI